MALLGNVAGAIPLLAGAGWCLAGLPTAAGQDKLLAMGYALVLTFVLACAYGATLYGSLTCADLAAKACAFLLLMAFVVSMAGFATAGQPGRQDVLPWAYVSCGTSLALLIGVITNGMWSEVLREWHARHPDYRPPLRFALADLFRVLLLAALLLGSARWWHESGLMEKPAAHPHPAKAGR